MKINEVIVNEEFSWKSLRKNLAVLIASGALSSGLGATAYNAAKNTPEVTHVKIDPELTKVGREALKTLPDNLQKKVGNADRIYFAQGIPEGGNPNGICQVGENEKVIFVNPKFVKQFLDTDADQLADHEFTHIAQDRMDHSFVPTNPDEKKMYGFMNSPDAWKILKDKRQKGDNIWNYSREEQAMLVQQLEAQKDLIKKLEKEPNSYKKKQQIALAKEKISVYNEYINDFK